MRWSAGKCPASMKKEEVDMSRQVRPRSTFFFLFALTSWRAQTQKLLESNNQDTPHFKLSLLLEQELPECNRREKIDELAEKFCTNHGSSKNARKRLLKCLFFVPRARLDLLPFYSRMTATLDRVWPDIAPNLVNELEQQFHGQARFKKSQNLDGRMRTARYIGELTKFRIAPPIVALRCLRRCVEDFSGYNVEVACSLLESCGRFLYRTSYTHEKMTMVLDAMLRLSKAKVRSVRLRLDDDQMF
jgi:regulator of nonsense transcripts 2